MDQQKPPFSQNELNLQPASGRISAVVDSASADLAKPWPSVVYYGNEEDVSRGFLIALRAMGLPLVEQPSKPPKLPAARAKP